MAQTVPPQISGRWLLTAVLGVLAVAALCVWGALCLLFWQGSWQLLYHPATLVARNPASVGLAFNPIAFAVTDEGVPQLKGWWIPAAPDSAFSHYTVLFLHGQTGNIGTDLDALVRLHAAGVNVLAFDYRGYGQSEFARPSEAHWRQDCEWALNYLIGTRHIPQSSIVLDGAELGANLAIEVAAAHPDLAGVILESPIPSPTDVIFSDSRAKVVPARWLVRDRFDLYAPAQRLHIPVLWFLETRQDLREPLSGDSAYHAIPSRKTLVWLDTEHNLDADFVNAVKRWLDDLPNR